VIVQSQDYFRLGTNLFNFFDCCLFGGDIVVVVVVVLVVVVVVVVVVDVVDVVAVVVVVDVPRNVAIKHGANAVSFFADAFVARIRIVISKATNGSVRPIA